MEEVLALPQDDDGLRRHGNRHRDHGEVHEAEPSHRHRPRRRAGLFVLRSVPIERRTGTTFLGGSRGGYRDETDAGGVAGRDGRETVPGAEGAERPDAISYTLYRVGGESLGRLRTFVCSYTRSHTNTSTHPVSLPLPHRFLPF